MLFMSVYEWLLTKNQRSEHEFITSFNSGIRPPKSSGSYSTQNYSAVSQPGFVSISPKWFGKYAI